MFSSSQFDGGFMASQSTQMGDGTPSAAKTRDSHGLVPATVKMISQASQSGDEKSKFAINGVDVTNVTVVGMVSDIVEKVTDMGFIIDDGTGRIGCKRWVSDGFDKMEAEAIQDGKYVRVNGHLNSYQGTTNLVAFSVRPVTNFDEVTFHHIDCIYSYLQNTKTKLSKQYSIDGLKDCDQLVLECLKQSSDMGQEKGMHVDEVCKHLKLPLEKIKESVRSLEDEGLIYSTIDEFHYKAT
ncbi:unnamed protein product [Linum tenue]|uniref:Uncharacterized protein n=1 Tax=Linum tenue TaxID=586396 RepID=A0AAV0GUV1_9ROSI|nr:unnamed protein product [Linum tenue]